MSSAFYLPLGQQSKPAFHQIKPRAVGRDEMQMESRMLEQPPMDSRRFVRGIVIQNQMNLLAGGNVALDDIQEVAELLGSMTRIALTDDLAGLDVQGREQRGRPVPLIVGGASLGRSRPQGQDRLCALQGLNLALLIHRKNQRTIGRA